MYWMRFTWTGALLLMAGLVLFVRPAVAAGNINSLQILTGAQVIQCAADLQSEDKAIAMALKDGIITTAVWHIQVARVRKYWLNKSIADIMVLRRVKPDLLSRSWLLVDGASGISRRVRQLDDAIQFLSHLQQFPVLDRSLLDPATLYRMTVKVSVYYGKRKNAWWSLDIWHPDQTTIAQDFKLP